MSNADRDPHLLISARIADHRKMIELPSDRARWGWIVLLGEAKLQRPPGRFGSIKVLHALAGRYREYVPAYLDAKLLEAAPAACDRCRTAIPDIHPDEIVVHDWLEHQDRVSRTTEWRRSKDVSQPFQPRSNETSNETPVKPLARVAALSQSQLRTSSSEGVQGEPSRDGLPHLTSDAIGLLEGLTGRSISTAGTRQLTEYDRQIEDHGPAAVAKAYERAALAYPRKPTAIQLVWAARKVLEPIADVKALDLAEREEEQRRIGERRLEATRAKTAPMAAAIAAAMRERA